SLTAGRRHVPRPCMPGPCKSRARGRMARMTELDGRSVMLPGSVAMPLVGLGTWQLRGSRGYESVRRALAAGYRPLDTATMYGNEVEVGRAVRDSGLDRRDVFITTKLPPGRAGQEERTLAERLRALGTASGDL